jgi:hypothetical protein
MTRSEFKAWDDVQAVTASRGVYDPRHLQWQKPLRRKGNTQLDAWSVDVFGRLFFCYEPDNARAAIEAVKMQ